MKLQCPKARLCGGCPGIFLDSSAQRAAKLRAIKELFFEVIPSSFEAVEIKFDPAEAAAGYRNRIRLQVDDSGRIGFFNREKDEGCVVLQPELRTALQRLRSACHECPTLLTVFSHLELRAPDMDGKASVYFSFREGELVGERDCAPLTERLSRDFLMGFNPGTWQSQRYPLACGIYQRVALGSFMQVNFAVNRALVSAVVAGARSRSVRRVLDLFCGGGNFLLPLLNAGMSGVGVEKNPSAILAARLAAREQALNGDWICEDVLSWALSRSSMYRQPFDLLILDPPRAGLGKELDWLRTFQPRHIALCFCSNKTLKRDLLALLGLGFAVSEVTLFDMFEHTDQVEVLVWLSSSRANESS